MSETAPQPTREDEQIIITDLAPRQASSSQGATRFVPFKRPAAFFQGARICFILLASLLVASILFQPPASITPNTTLTAVQQVSPSQPAIVDLSEQNGVTYIATQDQAVAAYRSSDGSLLWRHNEDGLVISVMATDQAVYCLLFKNGYGRIMALYPDSGITAWGQKIPIL